MKKSILIAVLCAILVLFAAKKCEVEEKFLYFTLLQTADLHNHAAGCGPSLDYTPGDIEDNDCVVGGFSRLESLIIDTRDKLDFDGVPYLLVDSGDFSLGSVYDLATGSPLVMQYFKRAEYDAVCLGEHEFDRFHQGVADLVEGGFNNACYVPILASNMVVDNQSAEDDAVEDLIYRGLLCTKRIVYLHNDLKVGILGLIGPDAVSKAPYIAPITFNNEAAFLQERVDELKKNEEVDVVVVLNHAGIDLEAGGDATRLAEDVEGIDIVAAAHEHTATPAAFQVGPSRTLIFSPGKNGGCLSRLDITYDKAKRKIVDWDFSLLVVNDSIPNRSTFDTILQTYREEIDRFLKPYDLSLDKKISAANWAVETAPMEESALGNLVADALRDAANRLVPINDAEGCYVGVVANGVIGDGLLPGKTGGITFADVYNVLPMGMSSDTTQPLPGFPTFLIHMRARDLKNLCEAGLSLPHKLGPGYYLNFSGIRVHYKPNLADRLEGVEELYRFDNGDSFCTGPATRVNLKDNLHTRFHLIVDSYTLQIIEAAKKEGLNIVVCDENGVPIEPGDYMKYRIDSDSKNGIQELKDWQALLTFLEQFFPVAIDQRIYDANGSGRNRIIKK